MIPITLHGEPVRTIFDLLGREENDLTYGLGWCLSQEPAFLDSLGVILGTPHLSDQATVRLQEAKRGSGITDIEVHAPGRAAWIIEAKRGFTVPSGAQLKMYARRLRSMRDPSAFKSLAVLAQSDQNEMWLRRTLPTEILGIPVHPLSWRQVRRAAKNAKLRAGHVGKRLVAEFIKYLNEAIDMKNETSNMVYVVSLSRGTFGGTTTFVDVVENHRKYFHPIGGGRGGWPTEPPNYVAFRYDGRLQSIHHVENYEVITDFAPHFRDVPSRPIDPRFLYNLGPAIRPAKRTPTGARWQATRVWCFIDTLLRAVPGSFDSR